VDKQAGNRIVTKTSPDSAIRVVKETPNLRELTTQALRNAILNMHFKPNERLIERRLCEQTGVSRTCVREALQHLESEGLVTRIPNRGLYVTAVTPDEARQIYEVRAALESMAGRLFVERTDDETLRELQAAFKQIERSINREPVTAYVRSLDGFYDVLLRGARNDVARRVLRTLRARISYLRALTARAADETRHANTLARMQEIVEAASRRDAETMARLCSEFVQSSAAFAAQVLAEQED
jgi:DNA-binding GntR family transcriptional regulator